MKTAFEIVGLFIVSLFFMTIPILFALSFAYDWFVSFKFLLTIGCIAEWVGLMSLLSEISDKRD